MDLWCWLELCFLFYFRYTFIEGLFIHHPAANENSQSFILMYRVDLLLFVSPNTNRTTCYNVVILIFHLYIFRIDNVFRILYGLKENLKEKERKINLILSFHWREYFIL